MKKFIPVIILFTCVFLSCKPEKSPEPDSIETKAVLKIELEKSSYVIGDSFLPIANWVQSLDTTKNVSALWLVSVDSIASINASNFVELKKAGDFQLIAQFSGLSDTVNLRVIGAENPAKSIEFNLEKTEFSLNESLQLSFKVLDKNSDEITPENTIWKIGNKDILSISSTNLLQTSNFGETTFYAESNGLKSVEKSISVYRNGTFVGKQGYSASGDVILVSRNGQLFIETASNFNIQGGPDLRVFLANTEFGSSINTDGLELSLLKSNTGKSTYAVPKEVKISDYQYIIIQCKQFKVTFGSAKLN